MTFSLHERLRADTLPLGELGLCSLLLMNDARFPWIILVPRRAEMREIVDLDDQDQAALFAEMRDALKAMRAAFRPDKLNLGAIGNMVPQLHVHIVARFEQDDAWPKPVWGSGAAEPYEATAAREMISRIRHQLNLRD